MYVPARMLSSEPSVESKMLRELLRKLFPAPTRDERGEGGAGDDDFDSEDPFPEPVRLEIRDVIDLHAFAPRDVQRVVEEYLLEARAAGYSSVRIIHGKGVGVQREAVRKILARTPFVEHFGDAPPEAGGWGATVVRMKRNDECGTMNDE